MKFETILTFLAYLLGLFICVLLALKCVGDFQACKDTSISKNKHPSHVICYSGGKVIYSGVVKDYVRSTQGFNFEEEDKTVKVTGDCVIEN